MANPIETENVSLEGLKFLKELQEETFYTNPLLLITIFSSLDDFILNNSLI